MIRLKQVIALTLGMLLLGTAQATEASPLTEAVNNPARSEADRQRDERSKPDQAMAFMGVTPGMTVLDTGHSTTQDFHRIDPEFARQDFERIGFVFLEASDVLRNPDDDHSVSSFDPSIRGKTDKFAFRFVRPQD